MKEGIAQNYHHRGSTWQPLWQRFSAKLGHPSPPIKKENKMSAFCRYDRWSPCSLMIQEGIMLRVAAFNLIPCHVWKPLHLFPFKERVAEWFTFRAAHKWHVPPLISEDPHSAFQAPTELFASLGSTLGHWKWCAEDENYPPPGSGTHFS